VPSNVDVLILGELKILVGGRVLDLPGPSVRALLAALLLTPADVVGDERLLDLAWGPGRGSRRALQCAVHRLREWLRRDVGSGFVLEHAGSGYRLTVPENVVDLQRFRRLVLAGTATDDAGRRMSHLRAALGEWRGAVLGGRPEWLAADPVVRAVEQARVDCAVALADVAMQLGLPDEAVAAVRRVAGAAPYDEPLQARLVRLLSTSGRHAEALRHVESVRRLLADELGTTVSDDLQAAHAAALRRDDHHGPVPQQLPPDVPDFTGRAGPAAAIAGVVGAGVERHAPLVFGINGPAGVGTSALAVHVAHRLAPGFADGQLYADLRGNAGRPVDPGEVLDRFLRALGVPGEAVPAAVDDRAALYRSRTAARRVVLLLDNAVDEAQVRPLVPGGAGCVVLVTSRIALLGLAGARQVPLGGLPAEDAVRLLATVCGREGMAADPAASVIAGLCGHLPLAVRTAGVRLATRPLLTTRRLADLLRDEDHRLDELALRGGLAVRPRLEAHYRELADADRAALRRLALLRADTFPAWAAAAVLDVSLPAATARLETLVDTRVVDIRDEDEAGQLRYGVPELVAVHARECGRAEDSRRSRDAAVRRAFGAWLQGARECGECLRGPGTPRPLPAPAGRHGLHAVARTDPRAWFTAEAAAVRAAVDQAWRHGMDDVAVALAVAMLPCRVHVPDGPELTGIWRTGLSAAERSGDRTGHGLLSAVLEDLPRPIPPETAPPAGESALRAR
jgi:DNA-binding SARP family transcriptional activator